MVPRSQQCCCPQNADALQVLLPSGAALRETGAAPLVSALVSLRVALEGDRIQH